MHNIQKRECCPSRKHCCAGWKASAHSKSSVTIECGEQSESEFEENHWSEGEISGSHSRELSDLSNFPTFPSLTPSITMLFKFGRLPNFQILQFWIHPSRRSPLCHSATHLLFVTTLIPSTLMYFSWSPRNSVFILSSVHIADSLFNTRTTTHRSSIWSLMSFNTSPNAPLQIPRSSPSLIVTTNMLGWVLSPWSLATVKWLRFFMFHPFVFRSDSSPQWFDCLDHLSTWPVTHNSMMLPNSTCSSLAIIMVCSRFWGKGLIRLWDLV